MSASSVLDAMLLGLDVAALEREPGGRFVLFANPPAWFTEFFPGAGRWGDAVPLTARFPFLENFVVDAEGVWASATEGHSLASGLWLEKRPGGEECYLEATAVRADSHAVILVDRSPLDLTLLHQIVQRGRDQGLLLHGERRLAADLRREHEALHQVVASQGAALAEATLKLHEALTARRNTEDQLRHSVKMEAIGLLAGGLAHDFNNLLTAILGYSELALQNLRPEDPVRADVERITTEAERAAALTRQLLTFSRRRPATLAVLVLDEVARGIGHLLRRMVGETIRLEITATPGLWHVEADAGQIEQLIVNLAVNARDAMPAGGTLTIALENHDLVEPLDVSTGTLAPGSYVRLEVRDTGAGMEPAVVGRIFEPFFTTKAASKGTGLGLSVVYGVVRQSGGQIDVTSRPGAGTAFQVYLPRTTKEVAPARATPGRPGTPRGTETILLVEDEDVVRDLLVAVLRTHGYTVLTATGADSARAVAAGHEGPIHLLVTDVILPAANGRQLAEAIATGRPEMATLFISGYTDEVLQTQGIAAGDVAFLQKPFLPQAFLTRIRQELDGRG